MTHLNFDPSKLEAGGLHVAQTPAAALVHVEIAREKALNALLPETFHALHHILDTISAASYRCYLLLSGRGRAFSAGGDVRALRAKILAAGDLASAPRRAAARDTLSTEYDLLARLAALRGGPLVSVAVADGLAFGAGAGLFQACAVRLVTPRALLAMPEPRIGIIPDCGATRFFAAAPGCTGMYAALTGARLAAADLRALGLADGAVPSAWRGAGLSAGDVAEAAVLRLADDAAVDGTATAVADAGSDLRRGVDQCFSLASYEEVEKAVAAAAAEGHEWAVAAAASLKGAAPRALRETFRAMRVAYAAENEGLRAALDRELEADSRLCAEWDFEEGVRAVLVDKDNQPKWQPVEG